MSDIERADWWKENGWVTYTGKDGMSYTYHEEFIKKFLSGPNQEDKISWEFKIIDLGKKE